MLEKYRRIKLALIIFISIITIFVGFTIYSLGWTNIKIGIRYIQLFPFRSVNELKFKSARKSDDKLTSVEMVEDLNQLEKDILEVHPSTIEGLSKNQKKLFEVAYEKVKKPMAVFEFNILISEILSTLQDAHSKTYLSNNQGEIFPIKLKFIDNKFYLYDANGLQEYDELISIGGISIETLFEAHKRIKPSENIYWSIATFEEQGLQKELLEFLGGKTKLNQSYDVETDIVVNRAGSYENVTSVVNEFIPSSTLTKYENYVSYGENHKDYSYNLDKDKKTVHFLLKSCIPGDDYDHFLRKMFIDIKENNVDNIIVDLRGNTGGNDKVTDDFIAYISNEGKMMKNGLSVRFSEQAALQRGYLRKKGIKFFAPNNLMLDTLFIEEDLKFHGEIFVITDGLTFSSGAGFAVFISDNNIGTVVGTPTGGKPTCYGDILCFQLRNSKLNYTISHKIIIRPDTTKSNENSLYPDYEVNYTLEDYRNNRDLEMEKIHKLINGD